MKPGMTVLAKVSSNSTDRPNELVVGQSPVGKIASTETEDIVGIRHQATAGEDTAVEKT
jgi:hypothetical protein